MKRYSSVEDFYGGVEHWQAELAKLRSVICSMPLEEVFKWNFPCYTYGGKNVVGVGGFKAYFGIWFYQGALLSDPAKFLVNAQEGKTKALRQWRMTSAKEIKVRQIKSYINEAMSLVDSGQEVKFNRNKALLIPVELEAALAGDKKAAAAFRKLTTGRQREYADYISEAKRADTKTRRIAKILPMIVQGGGLNDKYRNC